MKRHRFVVFRCFTLNQKKKPSRLISSAFSQHASARQSLSLSFYRTVIEASYSLALDLSEGIVLFPLTVIDSSPWPVTPVSWVFWFARNFWVIVHATDFVYVHHILSFLLLSLSLFRFCFDFFSTLFLATEQKYTHCWIMLIFGRLWKACKVSKSDM